MFYTFICSHFGQEASPHGAIAEPTLIRLIDICSTVFGCKMGEFSDNVVEAIKVVLNSDIKINRKRLAIFKILDDNKLSWFEEVTTDVLAEHTCNRGGLMLNPFDVHRKGYKIVQVGPDLSKLTESCAIQLSPKTEKKTFSSRQPAN